MGDYGFTSTALGTSLTGLGATIDGFAVSGGRAPVPVSVNVEGTTLEPAGRGACPNFVGSAEVECFPVPAPTKVNGST